MKISEENKRRIPLETMAVQASIDFHEYENFYFIIAFKKGFKAAQELNTRKATRKKQYGRH